MRSDNQRRRWFWAKVKSTECKRRRGKLGHSPTLGRSWAVIESQCNRIYSISLNDSPCLNPAHRTPRALWLVVGVLAIVDGVTKGTHLWPVSWNSGSDMGNIFGDSPQEIDDHPLASTGTGTGIEAKRQPLPAGQTCLLLIWPWRRQSSQS